MAAADGGIRRGCLNGPRPGPGRAVRRDTRSPAIDDLALAAARAADRLLAGATERGATRWVAFLEPIPDHLRDDELTALRATAVRARAAYGPKDSIRDASAGAHRTVPRRHRSAHPGAGSPPGVSPSSAGLKASSRKGDGAAGS